MEEARAAYAPPPDRDSALRSRPQSAMGGEERLKARLRARDEKIEALERELAMQMQHVLQLRQENERLKAALKNQGEGAAAVQAGQTLGPPMPSLSGKAPLPPLQRGGPRKASVRPSSARVGPLDSARQLNDRGALNDMD